VAEVDVIATCGPVATRSAKEATVTIPVVMAFDNDPVGSGFVARSWFSRTDGEIRWALWLRFSALLFGVAVLGLMEGVLQSQYGFVWFLAALGVTLFLVAKFAPKLLKQ
jgi:hypothetical protein